MSDPEVVYKPSPERRSAGLLRYFQYGHLPEGMVRETSMKCADLATTMDQLLEEGPEKTAGLRKLLEAKDCFVRQMLADLGKA